MNACRVFDLTTAGIQPLLTNMSTGLFRYNSLDGLIIILFACELYPFKLAVHLHLLDLLSSC